MTTKPKPKPDKTPMLCPKAATCVDDYCDDPDDELPCYHATPHEHGEGCHCCAFAVCQPLPFVTIEEEQELP